jgi:hypothetical protein
MRVDLDKEDLISLVYGTIPTFGGNKLTNYTGNQWNEQWTWDKKKLSLFEDDYLWKLYIEQKEANKEWTTA